MNRAVTQEAADVGEPLLITSSRPDVVIESGPDPKQRDTPLQPGFCPA
jgi:hypothetical protein